MVKMKSFFMRIGLFLGLSFIHMFLFIHGYYQPYSDEYPLITLLAPIAIFSLIPINSKILSFLKRSRSLKERKEGEKEVKVEGFEEEEKKEESPEVSTLKTSIDDKFVDEIKIQVNSLQSKIDDIDGKLGSLIKNLTSIAQSIKDVNENMNAVLADIRALMNEAENPFVKLKLNEPQFPSSTNELEGASSVQLVQTPKPKAQPSKSVSRIISLTQIVEDVLKRYPVKDIDEVLSKYLELGLISEQDLLTIYNLIDIFLSTRVETEKMIELLYKFKDYLGIDDPMLELEAIRRRIRRLDRGCLLYTSPSPRDLSTSRMPSSA